MRLEDNEKQYVNAEIESIDNALRKAKLDDDIIVYRVVDQNGLQGLKIDNCVGEIYNDKAFMSTSPVYKGVLDGVKDSYIVMKIKVPEGNGRGAYINSLSEYRDAVYEYLLERDIECRIIKTGKIDGKDLIEMEVLPHD